MSEAGNLRRRRLANLRRRKRPPRPVTMTLVEHLDELRSRLIICAGAFVAASIAAFFLFFPILDFLLEPLCDIGREHLGPQGCRLITNGPLEGFLVRLKVTAMVGIVLASPVWLYQLWAFVVPALTSKEKHYAAPFVATSLVLFAIGSTFAYLTLPTGLNLLVQIGGDDLVPFFRAQEYLNFVGLMLIAFGLTFELPLVLFFLGLVGVVTPQWMRQHRKAAIVSIVALAAVVTPSQDPYTLLVLAVPLYGLYEATIALLAIVLRRRARRQSV
jgi:sec-independent protein translocase protein TatC